LCNTTVAQDESGQLHVYVNGERIVGQTACSIGGDGNLVVLIPQHAYRLAGPRDRKRPVLETKDNVISFPLMQEYREKWAKEAEDAAAEREAAEPDEGDDTDTPPTTDGDSA
jgi:hypothetical protein